MKGQRPVGPDSGGHELAETEAVRARVPGLETEAAGLALGGMVLFAVFGATLVELLGRGDYLAQPAHLGAVVLFLFVPLWLFRLSARALERANRVWLLPVRRCSLCDLEMTPGEGYVSRQDGKLRFPHSCGRCGESLEVLQDY